MTALDTADFYDALERIAASRARVECAQIAMNIREKLTAQGDIEGARAALSIAGIILDMEKER